MIHVPECSCVSVRSFLTIFQGKSDAHVAPHKAHRASNILLRYDPWAPTWPDHALNSAHAVRNFMTGPSSEDAHVDSHSSSSDSESSTSMTRSDAKMKVSKTADPKAHV